MSKKTKHNLPWKKKSKPDFIEFSKSQQGFIAEVMNRQRREFGEVLESIYEELGVLEKVLQAPPGEYKLRKDYSGVDILPIIAPKKPPSPEEPPPGILSKKKTGKDN